MQLDATGCPESKPLDQSEQTLPPARRRQPAFVYFERYNDPHNQIEIALLGPKVASAHETDFCKIGRIEMAGATTTPVGRNKVTPFDDVVIGSIRLADTLGICWGEMIFEGNARLKAAIGTTLRLLGFERENKFLRLTQLEVFLLWREDLKRDAAILGGGQ